jgi:hypothetical protein
MAFIKAAGLKPELMGVVMYAAWWHISLVIKILDEHFPLKWIDYGHTISKTSKGTCLTTLHGFLIMELHEGYHLCASYIKWH